MGRSAGRRVRNGWNGARQGFRRHGLSPREAGGEGAFVLWIGLKRKVGAEAALGANGASMRRLAIMPAEAEAPK